ncbi:MAG: BTAD domain-containing putative transcriptional regulator [Acidiferrobacteraceae bacterium]
MWVTGPAGSGKTTLIRSYFSARGIPGLWHTLHAADGDPATFVGHLTQLVRDAAPRRRFSPPALTPEYLPGLPAFTRLYFTLFYARLRRPAVFVIDDHHELPQGSPVQAMLVEALSHLPPGVRAVVISRNSAPPEFARLQVNRQMQVLGWPDLRLTQAETAGLIRHLARQSSGAARARYLYERSDGWIAGVILLLEEAARKDPAPLPSNDRGRTLLFDFFAGEIFNRLDATEQKVLRRCAMLAKITAGMAERLSGEKTAGAILERLYRRHCFVDRRDAAEPVYRWHALFRQFLLARNAEVSTPKERVRAHYAAARLLETDGQIEEAAEQYQEAQAWPDLSRVLLAEAVGWIAAGRHQTLAKWLDAIPAAWFEQDPWLSYWRGVSWFPFDPIEGRVWFERAFNQFVIADSPRGLLLSWAGAVETFLFLWDDFTGLDRWIAWLDDRPELTSVFPSPDVEARVALALFAALVFRRPDHPDLPGWLDRVLRLSETPTNPELQISALFLAAFYLLWIGRVGDVGVLIERINQSVKRSQIAPVLILQRKVTEATHAWFTAAFDIAFRVVDEGLAMAEETGAHVWDHRLLAQGAYAALSQGDLEKARSYLARMSAVTDPTRTLDVSHHHLLCTWEAYVRGDYPAALEHGRHAARLAAQMGTLFPEALCRQGIAHVLHATGRHEDARNEIGRTRAIGRAMKSDYLEFIADLTDADELLQTGGDPAHIQEYLRRGLALARDRGLVNFPFWQPEMMSRVCGAALNAGIEVVYARDLIKKRGLLPDPASSVESWPWHYRIFTFGGFRLVRDGKPVAFPGKTPRKPLDLLKRLAAEPRGVSYQAIEDALWPEAEGDRAHHALETALYRLRRLLDAEAITAEDGRLRLDPRYCWSDVWAWKRLLDEITSRLNRDDNPQELAVLAGRAAECYAGPYLAGDMALWVVSERERLHQRWCRHLERLGQHLERHGQWEAAADCYRRAIDDVPDTEAFYHRLVTVCERLGHTAEAERVRAQLRTMLLCRP